MSRRIVIMPQPNGRSSNRSRNQQNSNADLNSLLESSQEDKEAGRKKEQEARNGSLNVDVRNIKTSRPIEDASVRVTYPGSDGGEIVTKNTDREGNVFIDNLTPSEDMEPPNMKYNIQIKKPGFHDEIVDNVEIVPEETSNRLVELSPTQETSENNETGEQNVVPSQHRKIVLGKLRVQVRDAGTSEPVEDATVRIYKIGVGENVIREVRTDETGRTPVVELAATNLPDSNAYYRITVYAPGYNMAEINRVDIEPNETVVENIYLNQAVKDTEQVSTMEMQPPSGETGADQNLEESQGTADEINEGEELPDAALKDQIGRLRVDVTSILRSRPIVSATVRVYNSGEKENEIHELTTDEIGRTETIELNAPNIQFSLEPSVEQPYSTYDLLIEAPGYESVEINSIEILPEVLAIQNVSLMPLEDAQGESAILYVIPPHTLYGDYPPKIAEEEIKPIGQSGEIVLSKVVIPEYVVVHDGPPSDPSAANYYVKYKDYIKNVASSEIYATWPEATIIANVLCIQSFCLNRVYTEWYRNKGYAFTITNSTAFDQKYIAGRNVFDSISEIVDQVFANYISRPNIEQPLFTQFCDGKRVYCPNWLSQWGSKELGDQGYSAIDILRNYYGNDVYISTAEEVSGVPASWPGVDLEVGSRSDSVRQIQRQLNVISNGYPLIPKIAQDGVYGQKTADAVKVFQKIFDLPQTGVVDFPTWYKISEIFVGVSRIAELN